MFRPLPAVLAAATLTAITLSAPAQAFDVSAMTDSERDAFRSEIRAYLLENPEVLMEAIGVLEARRQDEQLAADVNLVADNHAAIFEDGRSWVGGNPDGDLTLVEFMDYRCGYCKKAYPEVDSLLETDGNIRFIVKEFPILGEQSLLASRFAISVRNNAGSDAYAEAHDALMTFRGDITEDSLAALAGRLGLDAQKIMDGMYSAEVENELSDNHALAAKLGINGTPGFIFEDQLVRGYVPYDSMVQIIEQLRS
ncbi:DsbA family protein [Frigidibacter sp. ROC022]|uniref:DsbA family protein n=1 Tax=Frigidibacter sp. ROC022 TaxID=2971796 RepID=UPI00215A7AE5|nr:DsbA family protein [Frigidibacter sp. ROC022]MCR8723435.1 DsbA family protein [Frigidibacter sp. ROC022]